MAADVCNEMVALAVVPFSVPVSVAVWFAVRVPVEMLNVPVVAFAVTGTDAGAVKTGDPLLAKVTTTPPVGAACDSVTVHVALPFEDSVAAVQESPLTVAVACKEIVAIAVVKLSVPASVAARVTDILPAVTLNVAVVAFAATVTDAGAVKTGDPLLAKVTTTPPVGAASDSVTVQVALPFEDSVVAVQESPLIVTGVCNEMVALAVIPFSVPVSVTVWFAVSVPVEMLNVPVVTFAATVTDAGAPKAGDPLFVNVTTTPPVGAARDSVTVQVALPFEDSVVAVQESPLIVNGVCNEMVALAVVPFSVPVSVAVWFAVSVPVEMLNVPVVTFAATVTDAGAPKAGDPLFVNVTTVPPDNAVPDNVTVHVALPFELKVVVVQVNAVIVGAVEATVPPVAEIERPCPANDALTGFPTPIAALLDPEARVTVTVATTPLGMVSEV